LCDNCRYSFNYSRKELNKIIPKSERYFSSNNIYLYRSKGCEACNYSGYKGRTAIFELIFITPELQELILSNPSSQEIWKLANKQGARTLFQDGLDKVKTGLTSLEELLRVASPSEYL
jgi:type II secretory ATPase GspE/PulE/Tfp pilus assembly ATPase PilB-like protein